jgi:hypothetical protein
MKPITVTRRVPLLTWPLFLIFMVVAVLYLAGSPLASGIKAGLLLCAMSCPVIAVIGPRQVYRDFPLFVSTAAVGLVAMGCVATIAEALGQSPELTITIYLALGIVICLVRLLRSDPMEHRIETPSSSSTALRMAAIGTALMLISLPLVYSFRMGSGSFPAVFYQVDNPYHLSMVRSLIAGNQFPPASLNYIGQSPPYEYAMVVAAVVITRLTDLAPHTSYLLLALATITGGIIALCWLIARTVVNGWLRIAIMILLYLGTFLQDVPQFAKGIYKSIKLLLFSDHQKALPLSLVLNHELTQAGILFALFLVYLVLCRSEIWAKILLAVIVGLTPIVKAVFFVSFCTWIGTIALIEFGAEKPWRKSPKEAVLLAIQKSWPTVVAFAIGLVVIHIENFADTTWRITFSWFGNERATAYVLANFTSAAILFTPAVIGLLITRGRHLRRRTLLALAMALAPTVLVFVTALVQVGTGETNFMWVTVAQPATTGIALLAGLLVADSWPHVGRRTRMVVAFAFVVAIGTQSLRFPLMAIDAVIQIKHGSSVMDNRDIAQALQTIPVNGTLLVTNDLSNSASWVPNLLSPLSAIFGHQCFLSTPAYDYLYMPDTQERLAAQELLQMQYWQPSIAAAAKHYGWTHLLVHKIAPHPMDIPLQQIYDSDTYAVYRF